MIVPVEEDPRGLPPLSNSNAPFGRNTPSPSISYEYECASYNREVIDDNEA